jgi:hypothetical protein
MGAEFVPFCITDVEVFLCRVGVVRHKTTEVGLGAKVTPLRSKHPNGFLDLEAIPIIVPTDSS